MTSFSTHLYNCVFQSTTFCKSINIACLFRFKTVIGPEDTLMHKAERPSIFSDSFTHDQAEQIK